MAKVKSKARRPKMGRVARDIQAGFAELRRYLAGEKTGMKVYPPPPHAAAIRELRAAREKAGYSLDKVSAAVGVSAAYLGRLEAGRVKRLSVDVLAKYAAAVGMELRLSVIRKEEKGTASQR